MNKRNTSLLRSPVFALPSEILLILMIVFPILLLVVFGFADGQIYAGLPSQYSLKNYTEIFKSTSFLPLMWKSLLIGLEVTVLCIIVAFPAAWALAKAVSAKRRNLMVVFIIIPFFISQLLLIYSIMVLLQPKGILMSLLTLLNLAKASDSIVYSRLCVIIILVYEYLPYMILSLYSSLEQIDDSIIMASHTLGAGGIKTLGKVILPLAMPGLRTGVLLVFVPVVGSFVEPGIAGGPSGMMVGNLIDSNFSLSFNMCRGAAISLLFLIALLMAVVAVNLIVRIVSKLVGGGCNE